MQSQEYEDYEVVVIDGYSDDGSIEIAKRYADRVLFDEKNYGSACKLGFESTDKPIVGLFDGDIYFPHEDWLTGAVGQFGREERVSTVWPRNEAPPDANHLTKLYLEHWDLIIEDRIASGRGLYGGGNSLFERTALEEVGGIDDSIHWGADFDWSRRLEQNGYKVVYHRDPIYHHTMRNFRQFTSKQFSGASTFSDHGFDMMRLTPVDILREQFLLGGRGMIRGLVFKRKPCWILFPMYLFLRSCAYGFMFSKNLVSGK
jgi:glycosyltransferase involved in cell wall biosynthesis